MSPTGYYYINVIKTQRISRFGHTVNADPLTQQSTAC